MRSDEFWPAKHAAEALTLAGAGDEVIVAFRDLLPMEKDDQRLVGLAREMARAGDRSCLAVLLGILGDPKSNGRTHAAESLYKLGETGDGKLLQAAFEQTEIAPLRLYSAAALAKAGHADALAYIREQLRAEDRVIRNTAAYALARLGIESDIKPLRAALERETDVQARAVLISALATLGDAKARVELGRNLDSTDTLVRTVSAEFAGHSRCIEYKAKLIHLLDDPTLDTRVRAAESLIALSLPAAKW